MALFSEECSNNARLDALNFPDLMMQPKVACTCMKHVEDLTKLDVTTCHIKVK
ncbi:hypothetical protein KXX25_006161, partial [Aspergillus fumigatus]